ncbi:hypothetical protein NBT05_17930 [Aquimarina sp. ERC-38]|uniref:hypothetical protein n=1 Tax=Aquimarina sp. ERC-38 TaxID=2949996 RepID=UPI002247896D|nr:hypothetical protein [Aquimarina sp. ERC-38]UZO80805.1 hypothetical protein NBT05_17930 [Aquimarina sp. ERC-38]
MKKGNSIFCLLLLIVFLCHNLQAQRKSRKVDDWKKEWTSFTPNTIEYPEVDTIISGNIDKDLHLCRYKTYALSGDVYVTNNAKLSIGAGTIIRCDSQNPTNLIVTKGAKLVAIGSKRIPIVFTSNKRTGNKKAGDWGGIYVMGSGTISDTSGLPSDSLPSSLKLGEYGGTDIDEETVIMRYVRVEYGGKVTKTNAEGAALNFYALGNTSSLDNVMVSYSQNDSFSFTGGDGYFSKFISYKTGDDDFYIQRGFKGGIKKSLVLRDLTTLNTDHSFAIEAKGFSVVEETTNTEDIAFASFRNFIFANEIDDPNQDTIKALVSLQNLAKVHIYDSTISGFSNVVAFDNSYTDDNQVRKSFTVNNSIININKDVLILPSHIDKTFVKSTVKYNQYTENPINFKQLFTNTTPENLEDLDVDETFVKSARLSGMD